MLLVVVHLVLGNGGNECDVRCLQVHTYVVPTRLYANVARWQARCAVCALTTQGQRKRRHLLTASFSCPFPFSFLRTSYCMQGGRGERGSGLCGAEVGALCVRTHYSAD